ncbi:hypothetical protein ACOMHN_032517 [Nucella lapillus]
MRQWTIFHPAVFFLTFISYALISIVRKTTSYAQVSLISEWTPPPPQYSMLRAGNTTPTRQSLFQNQQSAEAFMGILNSIFLSVYAVGTFVSGALADRLDLRLFLTAGMALSAVVMFIFGPVLEWTGSYSQPAYIVLEIFNALFQSMGWPCLVPIMAHWFNRHSRGYLLGLWSSSSSVGSIVGALTVSEVVGHGYEYAFLLTSSMLLAGSIVVFFGLVTSPEEVDLQEDSNNLGQVNQLFQNDNFEISDPSTSFKNVIRPQEAATEPVRQDNGHASLQAISFLQAVFLPGVISYSLCFACLKLVLYVFYFWLPFYLASSYGWTESTADRLSLWFDVGGIVGATVCVFLMSRFTKTALIIVPMMLVSIPLLYVYGILKLGKDPTFNVALLFCLGSLLSGSSNPLSAAVSADLSQREALQGSTKSMSTVTGILEGSGTVGAALGQIAVPYLNAGFGRDSMFYFLMVAVSLSVLSILPVLFSEMRD